MFLQEQIVALILNQNLLELLFSKKQMKKYWLAALFGLAGASAEAQEIEGKMDLYNIGISSLEGKDVKFKSFEGKKILFVNVPSKCGFTGIFWTNPS